MFPVFSAKRTIVFLVSLVILIYLILFVKVTEVNPQSLPPNIWIQVFEDNNGFFFTCQNECEAFNQLGTTEELNKHFNQMHCTVNWYYALHNRQYGQIELSYLSGPNGDMSNPLCINFGE